MARSIWQVSRW